MHPGIELRITTPAGVVVQCDSDFAHYSTTFRGVPPGQWYTLVEHFEGHPVLDEGQGADLPLVGGAPLVSLVKVELRAIELEDAEVPDDARELLGRPDNAEQAAGWPGYSRDPIICEPCQHMCQATVPICCSCSSPDVAYWNFRNQPFCAPCADGKPPRHADGAALVGRRRRRWPWSRGDRCNRAGGADAVGWGP